MARPLRIELSGGLYHVTSRGDRREVIYLDDSDRVNWLALLGHVCRRFNWACHAYCLMDNHYHIVVETAEGNLSKGMRQLNGVYTQYINRTYNRIGHVYQGRYKAILVEKEIYLLELARYVVLNPVRAGMVKDIEEWPWSSYPAMIGESSSPPSGCKRIGYWGSSANNGSVLLLLMWILFERAWDCRVFGMLCAGKFIWVMISLSKKCNSIWNPISVKFHGFREEHRPSR